MKLLDTFFQGLGEIVEVIILGLGRGLYGLVIMFWFIAITVGTVFLIALPFIMVYWILMLFV